MILNETEVTERMNSPMNLLNRLRTATSAPRGKQNPFENIVSVPQPLSKDIIPDLDEKLSSKSLKNKANNIMNMAMDELTLKISETSKPAELAKIAAEMNKIVVAETEANRGQDNRPQFILYAPQFSNENHYETIYARE